MNRGENSLETAYQVSYRGYNSDTAYLILLSNRRTEMLVHYLILFFRTFINDGVQEVQAIFSFVHKFL